MSHISQLSDILLQSLAIYIVCLPWVHMLTANNDIGL